MSATWVVRGRRGARGGIDGAGNTMHRVHEGGRVCGGDLAYTRAGSLESYTSYGSNKMTENTIKHPMNQRKKQWESAIRGGEGRGMAR